MSASFKISLDAIGDGVTRRGLSSPGYRMQAGFVPVYPPPGEVHGLRLLGDKETLFWNPEPSVGTYNLYAGSLDGLTGSDDYGTCLEWELTGTATTDSTDLTPGDGRIYLVTAKNRLAAEGTKGWRSGGQERPANPSCP